MLAANYRTILKPLLFFGFLFLISGVLHIILGNNKVFLFIKVYIALFINFAFFYYYIKYTGFNINAIFQLYIKGAIFSSYLLIIGFFSALVDFKPGYDLGWLGAGYHGNPHYLVQPSALFLEPSHFAIGISPAVFIAIHNLITGRVQFMSRFSSIILLASMILSFASTGYIALFLSIILIATNYRAITIMLSASILGVAGFWILYTTVPKFQERVLDSIQIANNTQSIRSDSKYNASSLVLFHHFIIATENFKDHPIAGTGIGSHSMAHARYSPFSSKAWWVDLNKDDANSLMLRMMSETGMLGIILLLVFLVRFYRGKSKKHPEDVHWLICNGILVLLMLNLIRQGNYLVYGLPGFILMYYYNHQSHNKKILSYDNDHAECGI